MSSLYDEAVADAKRLRELALDNAKNEIFERLTPKLQMMIDESLLRERGDDPVDVKDDRDDEDDILLDLAGDDLGTGGTRSDADSVTIDASEPAGLSLPDDEGKITLDLDDFVVPDDDDVSSTEPHLEMSDDDGDDEMFLTPEAVRLMSQLVSSPSAGDDLVTEVRTLTEATKAAVLTENCDSDEISKILRKVKHTYLCVREAHGVEDGRRSRLEERLEILHARLKESQDNMKRRNSSKRLNEEDELTVSISGVPDDVDPDDVSASVSDAEGGEGEEDIDDLGDLGDLEDMEVDDDEGVEENQMKYGKKSEMKHDMEEADYAEDDDMKKEADELDEADLEVTISGLPDDTEPEDVDADVVGGEDEDVEGGDDLDLDFGDAEGGEEELSDDDVVEIDEKMLRQEVARMKRRLGRRLSEDQSTPPAGGTAPARDEFDDFGDADDDGEAFIDSDDSDLNQLESLRRRRRMREARRARRSKRSRVSESRKGSRPSRQLREAKSQINKLQEQLAKANVFNAKMVYANKLLARKNLTEAQKAKIVKTLDKATTIREVKLLARTLNEETKKRTASGGKARISESRSRGSASRATRRGSASQEVLEEGAGTAARWAVLANIKETG